ncbi:MAG: DUF373 family protein [Candidatus Diapherotrites archaeon]|nr:DUF373 family protein [Candidatus Diapherotrites archaeon]
MRKLLIVCIDRDNDLGKKTRFQGPVTGREGNLKAASALALSDPRESDANCIFAAVKKFDELKKKFPDLELATITGTGKSGFDSDREINRQLDVVLNKFPAEAFVLITDGAEDDQVIPILQSRVPIFSKELVLVKQAREIESAFFTVKEALKDPYIARVAFGLPGIVALFYGLTLIYGAQEQFFQGLMLIIGAYLLLKGFGIEEFLTENTRRITASISVQRTSFPFYIGAIFILVFGGINAYINFASTIITDPVIDVVGIAYSTYFFVVLAAVVGVFGRITDAIHLRKAYLMRRYILTGVSAVVIWFILDAGTLVFLRMAGLDWFLLSLAISFGILLVSYRALQVMDVKEKVTRLLVGLPVYTVEGKWLGKVERINKARKSIAFVEYKTKNTREVTKGKFKLRDGRILLSQ